MTEPDKKKRAGGRPPKGPDEKLEQFSIRLPPKLKFGLDLLARALGGRSLSQAVEWAVQRGLRSFEVSRGQGLGDTLDAAWEVRDSRFASLRAIYNGVPEALPVEDRWFVRAVMNSDEHSFLRKLAGEESARMHGDWMRKYNALVYALGQWVDANFDALKKAIDERGLDGKPIEGIALRPLVGEDQTRAYEELMSRKMAELGIE